MNRQTMIAAVVFVVVAVIVVAVLQFVFQVHGVLLKGIIGVVVGALVAGAAFMMLKPKAPPTNA